MSLWDRDYYYHYLLFKFYLFNPLTTQQGRSLETDESERMHICQQLKKLKKGSNNGWGEKVGILKILIPSRLIDSRW